MMKPSITTSMSERLMLIRAISRSDDLSKAQKKLLIVIVLNCPVLSEGVCTSVYLLAKKSGYSRGYITSLSSRVQQKGYLKSTPQFDVDEYGTKHQIANLYHLTLPDSVVALGVTD